jgi:hypothetical protein
VVGAEPSLCTECEALGAACGCVLLLVERGRNASCCYSQQGWVNLKALSKYMEN